MKDKIKGGGKSVKRSADLYNAQVESKIQYTTCFISADVQLILFSYNSKHGLAVFDHDLIEVIFPISSRTDLSTSPIPAFTSVCVCGGVRHVNISTLQGCTSGNCYQQTVPCAQVRRLTRLRLGLPFRERIPRSRSRLSPGRNTHLSLYNQSQRECA